MTRLTTVLLSLLAVGCSRSSTWEAVAAGTVPLADAERRTVEKVLEANAIATDSVRLLGAEGRLDASPTAAQIVDGHLTHLALEGLEAPPRITDLPQLRSLRLVGSFEEVTLRSLPELESLTLYGEEDRWRRLESDPLPALVQAEFFSGRAEILDLRNSPRLQTLAISRFGLNTAPSLPSSVISLSLDHNQLHDLSPLAGLSNLSWIDLSANGFQRFPDLPSLPALRFLRLRGNPLGGSDLETPSLDALESVQFPHLRKIDLRQTGLTAAASHWAGQGRVDVQLDPEFEARSSLLGYLQRLRASREDAPGELVSGPESTNGHLLDARGDCRWKTSTHQAAEVRCSFTWERLQGLAAARLGTTDLAMPYQGGGAPTVRATLRVQEGAVWIYLPRDFDNIALAAVVESVDPAVAESHRQPEDRFQGFRRILATPGSPAIGQGQPSLIGDRVLLWLEAEGGDAHGISLDIKPTS